MELSTMVRIAAAATWTTMPLWVGSILPDWTSISAYTTFTALIVVVTGQISFDTFYWTGISHFVIWGSLIFYFLLAFLIYEGTLTDFFIFL